MPKIKKNKIINIDKKYISIQKKKYTSCIFVNINNIKINNSKKTLLHNTNILLNKDKLWCLEDYIIEDNIKNYILEKLNIEDLDFYSLYKSENFNLFLIIISKNDFSSIKIKNYEWKKYLDMYKLSNHLDTDINTYFSILNHPLNSHIKNKMYPEIFMGNTYIKLETIYKKLCIHVES